MAFPGFLGTLLGPPMAARTRSLVPAHQIGVATLGVAILFVSGALGCQSEQDRFDYHLARATAAQREFGREETVVIELLNALRIRPDDAGVNLRLGQARQNQGMLRDAIFFFEEAHLLDPEDSRTSVELALLLRLSDVERADELLQEARVRDPQNVWVLAAVAELALNRDSPDEAVASATLAIELEPDFAFGHLALGQAHMGKIRMAQMLRERASDTDFQGADAAFKRYGELVPERERWSSLIERARVLAAWPGRASQSLAMFREALAAADAHAPEAGRLRVLTHVLEFARARHEDELRADALERLLELEPRHLAYWDELAQIREISSGDGGATLARLIEEQPHNPEAHLRYVGYLRAAKGSGAAIEHLIELADDEALRPTFLGALLEIYDAGGQKAKRDEILQQLEKEYPFHTTTLLGRAKIAFRRGRVEEAVQDLRDLAERGNHVEAEALLAYAEFGQGNYQAALEATSRARELSPRITSSLLELRANAAYATGNCEVARRTMVRLLAEDRLNVRNQVQLAHCLYQSNRKQTGQKLLRKLLSKPTPPVEAVVMFARLEMASPAQRPRLRRALVDALRSDPGNTALLIHLTEARRLDGLTREAIEGLDQALRLEGDRPTPELLLLRARLHSVTGDLESAQRDAGRALAQKPSLDGGLKFYTAALASLGRYDEAIAVMERHLRKNPQQAAQTARLGRFYLKVGDRRQGLDTLLRAYRMGCREPNVLNTLALMWANEGTLIPALRMAEQAAELANQSPTSLDTLGYVHLRLGQPDAALRYFERAIEESPGTGSRPRESVVARYHFRKGLALRALGRVAEASSAFEHAHSLDPTRPLDPPPEPAIQAEPGPGIAQGTSG